MHRPSPSNVLAVVLAGGRGSRLHDLTHGHAKPALPIGTVGRLIDFTLANVSNSGLRRALVLTQYAPETLHRHLDRSWREAANGLSLEVLDGNIVGPYTGTADAVAKVMDRIDQDDPDHVIVLAGDHLYQMDYQPFIAQHARSGARVTVGAIHVPVEEADQFGVMTADTQGRILNFTEKPARPGEATDRPGYTLASMGIYVFDWPLLRQILTDMTPRHEELDFGKQILPLLVREGSAFAYALPGRGQAAPLWRDLGTLDAYHAVHADLANGAIALDPAWPLPAQRNGNPSLRPAWVEGRLTWPAHIIGEGASVGERTVLRNVIVLAGACIGRDAVIENAIVTGDAVIPDGFRLRKALERGNGWCVTSEGGIHLLSGQAMARLGRLESSACPSAPQRWNEKQPAAPAGYGSMKMLAAPG